MSEKVKKKGLNHKVRRLLVFLFSFGGTVLAIYVAGWLMFLEPLWSIYKQFQNHTVTFRDLVNVVISVAMAATAGGGIWGAFDIIANCFREKEDD